MRLKPAILMSLVALLVSAPIVSQRAPHTDLRDFLPVGEHLLLVDGIEQPQASILRSDRAAAYLVISSALERPVLLSPRTQGVGTVAWSDLQENDDGTVDLISGTTSRPSSSFRLVGTEVVFEVGGREARLVPKPPLLGWKTAAELTAYGPEYDRLRDAHQPQASVLQLLGHIESRVEVQVYFGSWCPFCRSVVPRMLRVDQDLEAENITFRYYGMPERIQSDAEARRLGISSVPVGIVYAEGRELGRITGDAWQEPALALYQILLKAGAG